MARAAIDTNHHKGIIVRESITGDALDITGSDLTNANPQHVAIVDGSGDQITSFGGGTQYTEGDTDSTITGNAMMWEDTSDTLRVVSAAHPLPVDIQDASVTINGDVTISSEVEVKNDTGNPIPVSAASLPLPSGAATSANQSTANTSLSSIATNTTPATTIRNGKKTVTTAGTRVQLNSSSTTVKAVVIQALSTNTGLVYVGDSTVSSSNGFELQAGQATGLEIDNLNKVYIDSAVNGEGVVYLGSV